MTRRDFELIARVLAESKCLNDLQRATLAEDFARVLSGTNGGFKSQRFIDACNGVRRGVDLRG